RQSTVLVMVRVALAFSCARAAGLKTGLQCRPLRRPVRVGLTAEDASSVDAGVSAVEAQADAAGEVLHIVLGEACVGADDAQCGACAALVDAAGENRHVGDRWPWVGLQDLCDSQGVLLRLGWGTS